MPKTATKPATVKTATKSKTKGNLETLRLAWEAMKKPELAKELTKADREMSYQQAMRLNKGELVEALVEAHGVKKPLVSEPLKANQAVEDALDEPKPVVVEGPWLVRLSEACPLSVPRIVAIVTAIADNSPTSYTGFTLERLFLIVYEIMLDCRAGSISELNAIVRLPNGFAGRRFNIVLTRVLNSNLEKKERGELWLVRSMIAEQLAHLVDELNAMDAIPGHNLWVDLKAELRGAALLYNEVQND